MSSVVRNVYSSTEKCQWCFRQTNHIKQMKSCNDKICDRCIIKNTKCKSNCPVCWEKNISKFLIFNRICAGNIEIFKR